MGALIHFGYLLVDLGRHETAASFLHRIESHRQTAGLPIHPIDEERREVYFSRTGGALGDQWLSQRAMQSEIEPIDVVVAHAADITQRLSV